ncbi:hypothetical protein P3X46_001561 [Hevea brasiliensis]|uniref:Uncharacterized protein n=1 Tax=Hevea brasiliensis TaxID=3981 RepID=A0ABQ9NH90_HEVBR|nr:uncharacterized protein LOC110634094 isoform X2 [Hevea brasiliensis]KAJ9190345.1 hypothetical protein P3X46_001561 [Hevea brasiliensis]
MAESKPDPAKSPSEKDERAKEEIESIIQIPDHHKETHGTSDDIDENTSTDEVRGPGVFERVKEEVEALVEAIHPKKDENHKTSS